jgi:predicted component of type VI protein secretion system
VLRSDDVKGLQLGQPDSVQRLGWSTWICSTERDRDADETILSLQIRAA